MRADRLLSILLLLQRQPGMKTRELAKELEVSERSVLRDMDALSAAGIPVYAKRGAAGGWYLAEGYRSALNGLAKEEMMALLLLSSSRAVEDLGKRRAFERAIWKLLSALPLSYRSEAEQVRKKSMWTAQAGMSGRKRHHLCPSFRKRYGRNENCASNTKKTRALRNGSSTRSASS